jgi:hypothetical protein
MYKKMSGGFMPIHRAVAFESCLRLKLNANTSINAPAGIQLNRQYISMLTSPARPTLVAHFQSLKTLVLQKFRQFHTCHQNPDA